MSDLKNLAEGLKEFDDSRQTRAVAPPAALRAQLTQPATYPQESLSVQGQVSGQRFGHAVRPPKQEPRLQETFAASESVSAPYSEPQPEASPSAAAFVASASTLCGDLNERSLQMLREVQLALNLTSETETMNMMIALAHKSLKSLLA